MSEKVYCKNCKRFNEIKYEINAGKGCYNGIFPKNNLVTGIVSYEVDYQSVFGLNMKNDCKKFIPILSYKVKRFLNLNKWLP